MINEFNEVESRDTAVIFKSTFEQIKKLYNKGERERAGELAISAIELALTNQFSSDDFYIDILLENTKVSNQRMTSNYDKKIENQKKKKIEDLRLAEIAELVNQGLKQRQISEKLGIPQQTVSYRINIITNEFSYLLVKNQNFTKKSNILPTLPTLPTLPRDDNDNDNDNDNDKYCKLGISTNFTSKLGKDTNLAPVEKSNQTFVF